jgi:hypothetical protein
MRLYKWYEQQPKSLPIENIEETIVEVQKEIKKRGRKPKNNG